MGALEMSYTFYCCGVLYISGKSPEVFTIIQEIVVAGWKSYPPGIRGLDFVIYKHHDPEQVTHLSEIFLSYLRNANKICSAYLIGFFKD